MSIELGSKVVVLQMPNIAPHWHGRMGTVVYLINNPVGLIVKMGNGTELLLYYNEVAQIIG